MSDENICVCGICSSSQDLFTGQSLEVEGSMHMAEQTRLGHWKLNLSDI